MGMPNPGQVETLDSTNLVDRFHEQLEGNVLETPDVTVPRCGYGRDWNWLLPNYFQIQGQHPEV